MVKIKIVYIQLLKEKREKESEKEREEENNDFHFTVIINYNNKTEKVGYEKYKHKLKDLCSLPSHTLFFFS